MTTSREHVTLQKTNAHSSPRHDHFYKGYFQMFLRKFNLFEPVLKNSGISARSKPVIDEAI